jgi:hypothetical protein
MPRILSLTSPYRKWKRRQIHQTSALLTLPVEILLIVEDFLSDAEVVAFRMTCRYLYFQGPRLLPTLSGTSRTALLMLFEGDDPKHYYCHSCETLHALRNISRIVPPHDLWYVNNPHVCRQEKSVVSNNIPSRTHVCR